MNDKPSNSDTAHKKQGRIARLITGLIGKGRGLYEYVVRGKVWTDNRNTWRVRLMKTISLSIKSFFNSDLQVRSAALTFQTVLAIVPMLALLFAIGRGFGFQNLLQSQLFSSLPAQKAALTKAFSFVDSYLAQSSEGIFVGIGIAFLLWTLISLISSIEDAFNKIFLVPKGRSLWRKITDYTAICLILPVLMICSSGISVLMSSALQAILPFEFMSGFVELILDCVSVVLVWLFFAGTYMLVPNTKVKLTNALIAGVFAGSAFLVLQWLFLSGQIYVTKYNAIYGSFSFLPLLLIWLQLVWMITLAGGVLCYSTQNIYMFSYLNESDNISRDYRWRITVAVMVVCVRQFEKGDKPLSNMQIATQYNLPISVVTSSTNLLVDCNLLNRVVDPSSHGEILFAPAIEPDRLTLADVAQAIENNGFGNFLPLFRKQFADLNRIIDGIEKAKMAAAEKVALRSIDINSLTTGDGNLNR